MPRGGGVVDVEVHVVLVLVLDGAVGELAQQVLLDLEEALLVRVAPLHFHDDREALAEFVLQVLRTAHAAELAVDHNG